MLPVLSILGAALHVLPSTSSIRLIGMITDDQFTTYDLSFCIGMSTGGLLYPLKGLSFGEDGVHPSTAKGP